MATQLTILVECDDGNEVLVGMSTLKESNDKTLLPCYSLSYKKYGNGDTFMVELNEPINRSVSIIERKKKV